MTRPSHQLIFDEPLSGTDPPEKPFYTIPHWNVPLAESTAVNLFALVTNVPVGGQGKVRIYSEFSSDERTWFPSSLVLAIDTDSSTTSPQFAAFRDDGRLSFDIGFRRLRIEHQDLDPNPQCNLKVWATMRCDHLPVFPDRATASSADVAAPVAGLAASVSYAASTTLTHVITGVAWSYSATPTGGGLIIQSGASTVFDVEILAAGHGAIQFPVPKYGTAGQSMTVTLAAGGGAARARVSVLGHFYALY